MTTKEAISRQFDAINRHDSNTVASGYSAEATVFDPWYPEPLSGREAIARDFADFFVAVPDIAVTLDRILVDGDSYAVELTMRGTHDGPFATPAGEIPATHRRFELRGAGWGRFDAEGHIAEERRYYDTAGMMAQLGLAD